MNKDKADNYLIDIPIEGQAEDIKVRLMRMNFIDQRELTRLIYGSMHKDDGSDSSVEFNVMSDGFSLLQDKLIGLTQVREDGGWVFLTHDYIATFIEAKGLPVISTANAITLAISVELLDCFIVGEPSTRKPSSQSEAIISSRSELGVNALKTLKQ